MYPCHVTFKVRYWLIQCLREGIVGRRDRSPIYNHFKSISEERPFTLSKTGQYEAAQSKDFGLLM